MIPKSVYISLLIPCVRCENLTLEYVFDYLSQYGYVNNSNGNQELNELNIAPYLKLFQNYYNLPNDGTLNNETLNLIQTPRCGVADLAEYQIESKWNKKNLTWDFRSASKEELELTQQSFNLWEKHSALHTIQP